MKDAERVLELDAKATPGPWHLFNRLNTVQISSSKNHDHKDAVVFWTGFDSSDLPKKRKLANARLIHEYRTLAPQLARRVKELEVLLQVAKCPNDCIGGAIDCGDYQMPCQFCDEREQALSGEGHD